MKRFSEQFNTKSKSVKLSTAEKTELRERLVSYMEYHPLPAELKSKQNKTIVQKSPLLQEAFTTVSIPFSYLFKSSVAVAVFMLVVLPFVAERAVPGDTLYAVKVQFNEELRGTLTFDSVQKVEWETERMNRRIAEARLLESEGRLTEEVEAEVAQAVRTHSQNAQKEIAILREQDAEEATIASITFDSNLEAQATSLKDDDTDSEGNSVSTVGISTKTKVPNLIADAVDESRALNEQPNASSTPSYEKLMARIEISTTRVYELSESLNKEDTVAVVDVKRRVEDIERSISEAVTKEKTAPEESKLLLVDVLKRAQKLIVFMTDLKVSNTVDIEELVPVVLTDDEESVELIKYTKEIAEKQARLQTILAQETETDISDLIEKIEVGLVKIDELLIGIESAVDFEVAEKLAIEAIEIADDSLLALEKAGTNIQTPAPPVLSTKTASSTATTSTDTALIVEKETASTTVATTSTSTALAE